MLKILSAVLLAATLAACSGLPSNALAPKVSVAEVNIKSLGLFEQRFDVSLRVNNPNDFDIKIEALDFDLEVNGRAFAKGLARTTMLIPAMSSERLHVEAVTQSKNLLQQIKTLPPEALKDGVPYRVQGRVKTDKSSKWLPFDHSGVYGGDDKKKGTAT